MPLFPSAILRSFSATTTGARPTRGISMELAAAAMDPLLRKLGELLMGELTLERRVREDVVSLQMEMKFMRAALREVAEVPLDQLDEQVALWAREVRELSYDMEDAVDAFTVRVAAEEQEDPEPPARGGGPITIRKRIQEFLKKTARLFGKGKALHQIAGAVGDAQSLAKQLAELRQRYGRLELLQDGGTSSSGAAGASSIDPRLTAMFTEATELVGVDRSRDELIEMMSDVSKKHVQTVSIVGFGGLGKTTLAKAVYDRVKPQFDCRAFVSVSRSPDTTRVFKKMLYEFDDVKYADINEAVRDPDQLITELRRFLQYKRYLIVIDDIWDEKSWETIKCAFPENNSSSRIIITTSRKLSVSEASCSSIDDHIYRMKPLSDNDSQKLFHKRIFHRGEGCPPELEQVSKDILKKCGGVPLAVISIASLLASHHKHTIRAKDQWHIVLNSIGHGLTDGGNVEDMQRILSFSYYDLPSHLKVCLLYLSIFPEDYEIRRGRLIWRWIAEGLIQSKKDEDNLFELGDTYFQDLINRSMIQPSVINDEGKALACRVHDMVLDLIQSISRRENFVTIWDGSGTNQGKSLLGSKVRRLSLQSATTTKACPATTSLYQVRSFTVFNNAAIDSMPSLSQFQVLRVLDLEGCDLKKCGGGGHSKLRHVGNLSQLRYLGLRRTYIHELPVEIGKLQFLQTLDVTGAHGLQELPPTISGLRKLMCLHLDWCTRLPPYGLSNLTSLLELTGLRVGHGSADVVRELSHLTRLRVLVMRWEEPDLGEALVQSLGNLPKIQSLDVHVNGGRGDLLRRWVPPPGLRRFLASKGPTCDLSVLPAWVNSSSVPLLRCLDVWVGQVRPDDLQVLGALPALRSLRLRATGRIEDRAAERLAVRAGAFPCARACAFLHFVTAPSMAPPGAMPMVQRLQFSVRAWDWDVAGGGGLGSDDLRMGHLPSLEEVFVELWYRKDDGDQVKQVAAALRSQADGHPNRPTLRVTRRISRAAQRATGMG